MQADFTNLVLGAIRSLQQPRRADLVSMGELQRRVGMPADRLHPILRSLEEAGLVMCTPTSGPVAVVALTADASISSEAIAS
jgi:DNA-binding IclR family transcriptional regulator